MKNLDLNDFVAMDTRVNHAPIAVDLVYADARHAENIFGVALYHKEAQIWVHKDLAKIIESAAHALNKEFGYTLVLKDGLRTIEAQEAMQKTEIVKRNPHWSNPAQPLLSPPGQGAHPRGMAIDVSVLHKNGTTVDMGTPFDYLSQDPAKNPARRDNKDFPAVILQNRSRLEKAFVDSAKSFGLPLLPLPAEWWDFRFPKDVFSLYAPLSDRDLPASMRMTDGNF